MRRDPATTLAQLGRGVAAGDVSAVNLVKESLDRIQRYDSELNAVIGLRADEALSEARATDEFVRAGGHVGPLAGVPMLAKDSDDVAGMRTTKGSLLLAHSDLATVDGLVTSRLRAAGAIVIGKTNLPEFAIEGFTANTLFGATSNPWGLEFSPGGSSGGSAAALSAGLVPLATGTDGGGSVRIPAGLCGLLGFKPTNGVIGREKTPEWIDFATDGFMTTNTDDLHVLLDIVSGPTWGDPTNLQSLSPAVRLPTRLIAATRTADLGELSPSIANTFFEAVERLSEALQLPVEWKDPNSFFSSGNPDNDWFTLATAEHVASLGRQFVKDNLTEMHPTTQSFLEDGMKVTIDEYLGARLRRFSYIRELDSVLGDNSLLLTPTLAIDGFTFDGRLAGEEEVSLLPAEVYSTAIQNVTGLPAISLPAGLSPNGLPFGLQITGPRFADHMLLNVAQLWERAHPWPKTAPGYESFGS